MVEGLGFRVSGFGFKVWGWGRPLAPSTYFCREAF